MDGDADCGRESVYILPAVLGRLERDMDRDAADAGRLMTAAPDRPVAMALLGRLGSFIIWLPSRGLV